MQSSSKHDSSKSIAGALKKKPIAMFEAESTIRERSLEKTDRISFYPSNLTPNPIRNTKRMYWMNQPGGKGSQSQRDKLTSTIINFKDSIYKSGQYNGVVSFLPNHFTSPRSIIGREPNQNSIDKSQFTLNNESIIAKDTDKQLKSKYSEIPPLKLSLKEELSLPGDSKLLAFFSGLEPVVQYSGFEDRDCRFRHQYASFKIEMEKLIKMFHSEKEKKVSMKCKEAGKKLSNILITFFNSIQSENKNKSHLDFSICKKSEPSALEGIQLEKMKEKTKIKMIDMRRENNMLYTEVSKLKAVLGDITETEKNLIEYEDQINELSKMNQELKSRLELLQEQKSDMEFRLKDKLLLFAEKIDKLKQEKKLLIEKAESLMKEKEALKVQNDYFISLQDNKQTVVIKEIERQMMLNEELSERTRQVFELRHFIKEMKTNIGVLHKNRDQYNMRVVLQDKNLTQNAEDINKCLDSISGIAKNGIFTYTVSPGAEKDPYAGNSFEMFKALLQSQTSISLGLDSNKSLKFTALDGFLLEKVNLDKSSMEFMNYRMISPNIFSLVKGEVNKYPFSIEDLFTIKFRVLPVLHLVRAILDSYYCELLAHEEVKHVQEFGHFVYMWFEYFDLDPDAFSVCKTRKDPEQISNFRLEFLVQLSSPVFLKLWDSYFFIEALCNHFSRDEIAYYLYLRFYLFQGTQQNSLGVSFRHRVKFEVRDLKYAFEILEEKDEEKMSGTIFESVIRHSSTKSSLNEGGMKDSAGDEEQSDEGSIDIYLILRVYLEVYLCKKAARIKACYDTLEMYRKNFEKHSTSYSFPNFKKIVVSHYPHANHSGIVQLFSRIANFSQGGYYNLKSFFIAGQESCFFSLPGLFKSLYKYDFVRRMENKRACLDYRIEKKLHPNQRRLVAIVPGLESVTDQTILQEKAQEKLLSIISQTNVEEISEMRTLLSSKVDCLGSVYLMESYHTSLYSIYYPWKPSQNRLGPLTHTILKLKNVERVIAGIDISISMSRYSSSSGEFDYVKTNLFDYEFARKTQKEIEINKEIYHQTRSKATSTIQRCFKVKLSGFYKMIVELIKLNRVAQNLNLKL